MTHAITRMFKGVYSPLIFNHSSRVFYFASIVAARRGIKVNGELLYVSAMFHRFGLTPQTVKSNHPIEIDGANAAGEFLKSFPVSKLARTQVWDAVALSATPGVSAHKSSLARTLQYGIETDLLGMHFCEVTAPQRVQALRSFPREADFADRIIQSIGLALKYRTETAFGTVYSDILERTDPTYHRPNFCGKILGSDWSDWLQV